MATRRSTKQQSNQAAPAAARQSDGGGTAVATLGPGDVPAGVLHGALDPTVGAGDVNPTPEPPDEPIAADKGRSVMIECPLIAGNGYCARHLPNISARQAQTLRDLACGLEAEGTRLGNGKLVRSPADALSWLLDQLAANAAR